MKRIHFAALAALSGIALITSLAACTSGAPPESVDRQSRTDGRGQTADTAVGVVTAEERDVAVVTGSMVAPPVMTPPPAPPPVGMAAPKMAMPSPAQMVPQMRDLL